MERESLKDLRKHFVALIVHVKYIDDVGISPDVEIKSPAPPPHPIYDLNLDMEEDLQLSEAEELLRHQVDAGKILFDDDFWKENP